MLASPKELKCIEITSPIIRNNVLMKINKLEDSINPILSFRKHYQLAGFEDGLILDKKKILPSFIFLLLVLLLYPFVFIGNFVAMIFFSSEYIKSKKKEIQDLIEKSKISYDVSENKSFLQLWSDKGLRDYGLAHMHMGPYNYKEKFYCLSEWVKILYDEKFDLKQLEMEIRDRQIRHVREFYETHSPGSHITPANPVDLIPFEIDKVFGNYKVDALKKEISMN
jgi:hypothetical protein